MEPYVIIVLVIAIIAVVVSLGIAMFFHSKKEKHARDKLQRKHSALANRDQLESDLTIKFEDLPALTEIEDASLVEVKDKQLPMYDLSHRPTRLSYEIRWRHLKERFH